MTRIGALARRGTALWRQRSRRERLLLAAMAAALAVYLLAVGIAQPLLTARSETLAVIARHDAALARLAAQPDADPAPAASAGRTVTAIAAESAPDYELAIRRIEAEGAGARLELEDAGFAEVILWIEELERTHALRVTAVELDRRPEPGVVSARLTVTR